MRGDVSVKKWKTTSIFVRLKFSNLRNGRVKIFASDVAKKKKIYILWINSPENSNNSVLPCVWRNYTPDCGKTLCRRPCSPDACRWTWLCPWPIVCGRPCDPPSETWTTTRSTPPWRSSRRPKRRNDDTTTWPCSHGCDGTRFSLFRDAFGRLA